MKTGKSFSASRICALVALLGFGAIACASSISPQALQSADQSIGFETVVNDPAAMKGKTVLLGGEIIETRNIPGETRLSVSHRPLDGSHKPRKDGVSKGRFILRFKGFLDPAIYSYGRWVTAVGAIEGSETRPLGGISYTYPVISAKELHLWPKDDRTAEPRIHFGIGFGFGF